MAKTTDGGKTWNFTAEEVSVFDTAPLYALALRNSAWWVVGASGRVLRLQDAQWKPAPLGLPVVTWMRSINFFDESNGWIVGGFGMIIHTTDGGKTWRPSVG